MNRISFLIAVLALAPACAWGQVVSKEDQVRQSVTAFQRAMYSGGSSGGPMSPQKRHEFVDQMMKPLEPEKLSAELLLTLSAAGVLREYSQRGEIVTRLEKLAEARDAHGAAASFALVSLKGEPDGPGPVRVTNMSQALQHPGRAHLAPTVWVGDVMGTLNNYSLNRDDAVGFLLSDLTEFFRLDLGLAISPHLGLFLDSVEKSKLTPAQLDPLRTAMEGAIKRCRAKFDDKNAMIDAAIAVGNSREQAKLMDPQTSRPYLAAQLDGVERRLNGGFGGRLVDQPAPSVDLKWVQGGLDKTDTAELKGRIRILVKWWRFDPAASYSGTALIKQLSDHYANNPVDVVAISSFIDGPLLMGGKQIDPGGTREQQIDATVATAKSHGLAGPVAIADESRFGAAFGIRGANNAVVIDATGVVRATNLDGNSPKAIFQVIDGLLTPAQPKP